MATRVNAYLNFSGSAREAMTFYKDCIGGETEFMTVGGSPIEDQMPAEMKDSIMHSTLIKGDITIMATDMSGPEGVTVGNNFSLMLDCETEDEIRTFYDKLVVGGNATHPVSPAFWGGLFGHLTDKYGINWMLNCSSAGQG